MTKFMLSTARVQILSVILAVVGTIIAIDIDDNHVPDEVVSELIQNYLEPVIKNIKIDTQHSKNVKIKKIDDTEIVQTIEKKVNELKPRLDDSKPVKYNRRQDTPPHHQIYNIQDTQDTQILEIPKMTRKETENVKKRSKPEPLEGHIKKYKMLRRKIDKLLKTEAVSNKTNSLVTETLDQMIAEMITEKCVSNRTEYRKSLRSYSPKNKEDMLQSWKAKWNKLIKQYSASTNKDPDGLEYKEMFTFLIKLREFFFEIHEELNRQNDRYKFKCQVVESNTADEPPKKFSVVKEPPILRERPETKMQSDDNCMNIKICAEELKDFLMDFYINLKETVAIMFKNYEAMYVTDINADEAEKRSFVSLLRDLNTEINEKVSKTFKKQTENLKLNAYHNAQEKIKALKIFLKSTADLIERLAGKVLSLRLKSLLDSKMRFTVKEDLATTLGIELTNLNKDFTDKICLVFLTCNGSVSRRNIGAGKGRKAKPNEIHLKLQMGFPKAHMRRTGNDIGTLSDEEQDRAYNRYYQPPTEMTTGRTKFNARKYMETLTYNIIVTRTTHRDTEETPLSETTVQSTTQSATTEPTTKSTTTTTTESTTKTTTTPKTTKSTTTTKTTPKTTQSTTKQKRKVFKIIRRTITARPKTTTATKSTKTTTKSKATTTKSTTTKPETTTSKVTETTYTYGDYVRKMIALGKISPNPKWQTLVHKETTVGTVNRLIGAFIY